MASIRWSTLHPLSKKVFDQRFHGHPTENLVQFSALEKILTTFQKPHINTLNPHTPVILLVSGGIDSTVLWQWLLSQRVLVYPLFIRKRFATGNGQGALEAVTYFAKYFTNKYPHLNQPLKQFVVSEYPDELWQEFASLGSARFFHPQELLRNFKFDRVKLRLIPNDVYLYPLYGQVYAQYLQSRYAKDVKTILTGIIPSDGLTVPGQTLTHIRFFQYMINMLSLDNSFRFYAPFFERELGTWVEKDQVIDLARMFHLPLEKTWSCTNGFRFPCEICDSCISRHEVFVRHHIIMPPQPNRTISLLGSLFPHIHLHLKVRDRLENLIEKFTAIQKSLVTKLRRNLEGF